MHLKNANAEFGQNIVAALTFGEIDLLSTNLHWLEGLLVNYHYRLPVQLLGDYITAYYEAARTALDKRGDLILTWLAASVTELR